MNIGAASDFLKIFFLIQKLVLSRLGFLRLIVSNFVVVRKLVLSRPGLHLRPISFNLTSEIGSMDARLPPVNTKTGPLGGADCFKDTKVDVASGER